MRTLKDKRSGKQFEIVDAAFEDTIAAVVGHTIVADPGPSPYFKDVNPDTAILLDDGTWILEERIWDDVYYYLAKQVKTL